MLEGLLEDIEEDVSSIIESRLSPETRRILDEASLELRRRSLRYII